MNGSVHPSNGSTTPTLRPTIPQSPPPVVQPLPARTVRISLPREHKSFWEFWGTNEAHLIAAFSFALGIVFTGSLAMALWTRDTPQCWLYITFLSLFHFLEYFITAKYKSETVTLDAFLFNNGHRYLQAQILGILEFLTEWYLVPHTKHLSQTTLAGLVLVLLGQTFRTLAMIHAANNFSHQIALKKDPEHTLVTGGVYSLVRHPSYFGFFWWAVGLQVLMANPVSTVVFVGVLWRFFSERIKREEVYLVKFFDEEYVDYRKKVGTWIPFIQ